MDKKNTIIGVLLLLVAFWLMFTSSTNQAAKQQSQERVASARQAANQEQGAVQKAIDLPSDSPFAEDKNIEEKFVVLKNDCVAVHLTNKGGAIAKVDLLKFKNEQGGEEAFSFNAIEGALPAMSLAVFEKGSNMPRPVIKDYALVSSTPDSAVYELTVPGMVKITRTYVLMKSDKDDYKPYTLDTKTSIENISGAPLDLKEVFLVLGTVPPTASDVWGNNLALTLYDGEKAHFLRSTEFVDSDGFIGIGSSKAKPYSSMILENTAWGAIKNQFFASVFTPTDRHANSGIAYPIVVDAAGQKYMKNAVAGLMGFQADTLEPGQSWNLDGTFYTGPKELDRLFSMGNYQEEVMNYGWFGFVSRPLSRLMGWIHSWVAVVSPNWGWGWSIIILTIIVRGLMWPLTSIQIKSSQRMAKLAKPIKELKAKYKDDPRRVQQETMKLYSEYGINPLAGCFPVLIQIPIFIGLYYMLQTSAEIRFAHFLWIKDLSLPDTIAGLPTIFGMPIHLLPILNAIVTFTQMHITPMPNVDKTQAWMMKLMPLIMLLFFYTFPSGLVLYWLMQSLIGILQAIITRRGIDRVQFKKKTKPGFFQKMQMAMEQAQAAQASRGPEFEKLPLREKMKIIQAENRQAKAKMKEDRLKGTMYEKRKKNPGGRNTPKKDRK